MSINDNYGCKKITVKNWQNHGVFLKKTEKITAKSQLFVVLLTIVSTINVKQEK